VLSSCDDDLKLNIAWQVKVVSELELHFSQYLKRINVGSGQLVQDEEIRALQRETKH